MLPAYVADFFSKLLHRFKIMDFSVDLGIEFRKKRLFGRQKTVGDIFLMLVFSLVVFYFQKIVYIMPSFQDLSLINYGGVNVILGLLIGAGVILGDLVNTFVKIQLDKKKWLWDNISYALGVMIVTWGFIDYSLQKILIITIVSFSISAIYNFRKQKTKLRR